MSTSRVEPWLVAKTVASETSGLEARVYDRSYKIANNDFNFFTKESRRVMKAVLIKFPTECNYISVSLLTQRTRPCG